MSVLDQTMVEIIRGWAGEALKAKNILNQNGANLVYLHGKDVAHKLGLTEDEIAHIMPFPTKNVVSVSEQPDVSALLERLANLQAPAPAPAPAPAQSLLRRWGPAIALAAGTGLGGAALTYALTPNNADINQGEVGFTVE